MGRISGIALATVYGVAVGCGVTPTTPDPGAGGPSESVVVVQDSAPIALGETVTFESFGASVTYLALLSDSRCPTGVTCVWEGDAEVEVRVATSGGTVVGVLHTTLEPRRLVVGSVVVELIDVTPYPQEGVVVDPSDTRIVVRVAEDD